jgi:flavin reductase (DIM6/NTAB) family NADH-FMN oxidoreductase RutF
MHSSGGSEDPGPIIMEAAEPDIVALLRYLTLPVMAVTTTAAGRRNGFIINSAQRASLLPAVPRVSLYVSRSNHSHDLVYASGLLGLHLLRIDQWDVIRRLGFQSGRDNAKLEGLPIAVGRTGCPLLTDVHTRFECRVINAMDAGGATFFLADVLAVETMRPGRVMTAEFFRSNISPADRRTYEDRLAQARAALEPLIGSFRRAHWTGPTTPP